LAYFQADVEYTLLEGIKQGIKSLYRHGIPLHHLPEARLPETPTNGSSIFVVTFKDFKKLSSFQIQSIFHHRHILVTGAPVQSHKFDEEGLATLGSLTAKRTIQGKPLILLRLVIILKCVYSGISKDS
jgi:hypothetical protein